MNAEQCKGLAAFKKRAKSNVCVQKRSTAHNLSEQPSSSTATANSKLRTKNFLQIEETRNFPCAHGKVRFSILTKVIRYLRYRHQSGEDHFLSVEEIIEESNQHDVSGPTTKWLATEALVDNPKIECTPDKKRFRFKPLYRIKDGKALIRLLKQHDLKGLGGINLEDIKESLPNCDAVLRKYDNEIITIKRPMDKKTILFYNDKTADFNVDDEFKKMWRMVQVDSTCSDKIEEHLEKQGIRTMDSMDKPKFKTPKPIRAQSKKRRTMEKPKDNVHVADVLEIYNDNGTIKQKCK